MHCSLREKDDPDYEDELEKVYEFLEGKNQTALEPAC